MTEYVLRSVVIGIGATAIYDAWSCLLARVLDFPGSNWTLAGRWFCHMAQGRFIHRSIADAPSRRGETAAGWAAHYLIGIVYAAVLLAVWGVEWARHPTLAPALIVGTVTIMAGWFVMAPAMGMGTASARLPNANRVRAVQFGNHVVFGLGLYVAAHVPI
ncbi:MULTISPECIES: DUF2938 domain-containing protein [Burkholderia cepacia complex]|uniref:DUF2938 domain-containing protein n=1 Tax=Burkholderia cepacia complex TaxID=87882 RepID=UPI001CF43D5B|nr:MULTISPECIES: DUF2938 domain-containing protein [Burkholderia cepacia complex]MCA8057371.1 DUF2938 domain-containing protein [Burkholderia cepacia]MDN7535196.1 DUF2938 domain-containing protein [Burkholderia orbicola]